MTIDIAGLAHEIHTTAKDKGFWESERNMGEMLALVVSELMEALEEHRGQGRAFFYDGAKPEGTAVELADAVIRCLDTLWAHWNPAWGSMADLYDDFKTLQCVPTVLWPDTENFGENLMHAVRIVGRAIDNTIWLMHVVVYCERMATDLGEDIWKLARIKMDYNDTRPYKHGKKY